MAWQLAHHLVVPWWCVPKKPGYTDMITVVLEQAGQYDRNNHLREVPWMRQRIQTLGPDRRQVPTFPWEWGCTVPLHWMC